jgi:hypothetical protein
MPTEVSLEYTVNVVGAQSTGSIETELASVELDFDGLYALGYGFVSDTPSVNATPPQANRTIVLSLIQPELQNVNNPYTVPTGQAGVTVDVVTDFSGSIYSSSPNDSATGTGARTVTIHYLDALGGAHSQVVTLDGTTPVSLVNANYATIVSILITTAGSFGANEGSLTLTTASAATVDPCCPPNLGTVVASLPASSLVNDPTFSGVFVQNYFTGQLQEGTGSPVIAQLPVFS